MPRLCIVFQFWWGLSSTRVPQAAEKADLQPLLDEACRTHVTLAAGNYARLCKPDEVGPAMLNDPFVYALAAEVHNGSFNGKSDFGLNNLLHAEAVLTPQRVYADQKYDGVTSDNTLRCSLRIRPLLSACFREAGFARRKFFAPLR